MAGLRAPAETCCRKWLVQLGRADTLATTSAHNLAGSCLHFLAVYYAKLHNGQPEEALQAAKPGGVPTALAQFSASGYYQLICASLPQFSGYVCGRQGGSGRAPKQLPAGWSVLREGAVHPLLQERTPLHLLLGLFKLTATLRHLEMELGKTVASMLAPLQPYFNKLTSGDGQSLVANWFSRLEARLLFWILTLTFADQSVVSAFPGCFQLAVRLCGLLQSPDELLLRELLDKAVFSSRALSAETLSGHLAGQLGLETPLMPSSLAGADTESQLPMLGQVLADSLKNVDQIKGTYLSRLLRSGAVEYSHALHNLLPSGIGTLCLEQGTILPQDWAYLPLLEAYDKAQGGPSTVAAIPPVITDIRNCLAWLLLCETDGAGAHTEQHAAFTARYYRLATVFLCSSDLFLDPLIHRLLAVHLRAITGSLARPDLSLAVPGLSSGHEFYLQLLDQFQAVSYGDQLFGLYLVLPLSMKQPAAFRRYRYRY